MANVISILIQARDDGSSSAIKSVNNSIGQLSDKSVQADKDFAQFAGRVKTGLLALGAAGVVGLTAAIKSTSDYQDSLAQLEYAASATSGQMSQMSALAQQLGKDNTLAGVTAADAARTMVELSKAGLSVNDTMAAAKGVMSLARAGNMDFAEAATIAASALNAFGLEGKDAVKVADMLASGANASQADLSDLALGMQQSATVAKQFSLSLNENVTALALFANNGIKGSDAGTSLKTMLLSLANPSKDAAGAMKDIGFSAYDAQGQFVGLREFSERLRDSTKKLTAQQKQQTLATIFGTDAFRAAAVLSDNAGESYDKMAKSVNRAGAAQGAAAAQMGPFKRATEGMNNALSELAIEVGNRVLPSLTGLANGATSAISSLTAGLPGAISTIRSLAPAFQIAGGAIVAFTIVQNAASVSTKALSIAQGALNAVMRINPFALLAAGAAALITAYVQITNQSTNNTAAADRLRLAQDQLKNSTDLLKGAQQAERDALLQKEQADLAAERAQLSYNTAVAQYGPNSLEAREALNQLNQATNNAAKSNTALETATRNAQTATGEWAKSKETVRSANNEAANSAKGAADSYWNLGAAIQNAQSKAREAKDSQAFNMAGLGVDKNGKNLLQKHALGTMSSPGGMTLVGENGPELVNMPRGAAVTQAFQTRQALSSGGGGGVNVTITGPMHFSGDADLDKFVKRLDSMQRMTSFGMGAAA